MSIGSTRFSLQVSSLKEKCLVWFAAMCYLEASGTSFHWSLSEKLIRKKMIRNRNHFHEVMRNVAHTGIIIRNICWRNSMCNLGCSAVTKLWFQDYLGCSFSSWLQITLTDIVYLWCFGSQHCWLPKHLLAQQAQSPRKKYKTGRCSVCVGPTGLF